MVQPSGLLFQRRIPTPTAAVIKRGSALTKLAEVICFILVKFRHKKTNFRWPVISARHKEEMVQPSGLLFQRGIPTPTAAVINRGSALTKLAEVICFILVKFRHKKTNFRWPVISARYKEEMVQPSGFEPPTPTMSR